MQELIGSILASPEDMKAMMANECTTEVVDSEPLLSMYYSLGSEMTSDDDYQSFFDAEAPVAVTEPEVPDSVIACRPKGGEDVAAFQYVLTCCLSVHFCFLRGRSMLSSAQLILPLATTFLMCLDVVFVVHGTICNNPIDQQYSG